MMKKLLLAALIAVALLLACCVVVNADGPEGGVPEWVEGWEDQQVIVLKTGAGYSHPPSWDWRDVEGQDYVSPIKSQGNCGSCTSFAVVAAIEARYRIALGKAIDLSEAFLFFCNDRTCKYGAALETLLRAMADTGTVDEGCYPYSTYPICIPCADWQAHLVSIPGWRVTTNPEEMKHEIAASGPIAATFTVYSDFWGYSGGVYHHTEEGTRRGGHAVAIVGYDDVRGCWIIKNSWGTGWGEGGWGYVGYGEVGIDNLMYIPFMPYVYRIFLPVIMGRQVGEVQDAGS